MLQQSASTFAEVGKLSDIDFQFNDFLAAHGKSYKTVEEYAGRRAIFARALAFITTQNQKQNSWKVGLNKFADMT